MVSVNVSALLDEVAQDTGGNRGDFEFLDGDKFGVKIVRVNGSIQDDLPRWGIWLEATTGEQSGGRFWHNLDFSSDPKWKWKNKYTVAGLEALGIPQEMYTGEFDAELITAALEGRSAICTVSLSDKMDAKGKPYVNLYLAGAKDGTEASAKPAAEVEDEPDYGDYS